MATPTAPHRSRSGFPLGKIAGIQINVHYSWFIIFFLVLMSLSAGYIPRQFPGQSGITYWIAGLIATLLFFGSILMHELAHALMAQRSGIAIPEITLFVFGGVSRLSEEAQDPGTEFKIAIVGPLTSFALALLFWGLGSLLASEPPTLAQTILGYLTWINIALGIFNLIPGFPLDGGRILRAFLWYRKGSLRDATKVASSIGKGFAVVLMILGGLQIFSGALVGGLWLIFIGMFLRGMAEGGYQELFIRQSLANVTVGEVMIRDVVHVPPALSLTKLLNEYFLPYGYHGFPVLHEGKVLGVVSLENLRDTPEDQRHTTTVADVMRPFSGSIVIGEDQEVSEALKQMEQEHMKRLLVMDGQGGLRGMITQTGLMRFLEIKRLLNP